MDNGQNNDPNQQPAQQQPPQAPSPSLYAAPAPAAAPAPETYQPVQIEVPQIHAAPPATTNYNTWSVVIFVLLLLTFFTPLGSMLFLPLVIVGLVSAVRHVTKSDQSTGGELTPRGVGVVIYKVLMGVCLVIGLGTLAIIGFFFLLFSTGGARMGS